MGRTNGKLIPFLVDGLNRNLYVNLQYENIELFSIEFPRFEKNKQMEQYEKILKEWYLYNGKGEKYPNYSTAKAVFQASLKKSVYLVSLPTVEKKLLYRFATNEEAAEKKRLLKEKASINDPPSVSSSGYHSGNEDPQENMKNFEIKDEIVLEDIMTNPDKYIVNDDKDIFNDLLNEEYVPFQDIQLDDIDHLKPTDEQQYLNKPVVELKLIPVDTSGLMRKKFWWKCTQKVHIDSMLLLICEKQIYETESGIAEGNVVIPTGVLESNIKYEWKVQFELDEKYYIFASPCV